MKDIYKLNVVPFLIVIALFSCSQRDETLPFEKRGTLIEAKEVGVLTKAQVIERVNELDATPIANYDVTYYHITYRTTYEGKPIDTKGLLIVPNGIDSVRLMMYCHGTQLPLKQLGVDKLVPSNYTGSVEDFNEIKNMGLSFGTAGYVVFLPDYIGYGATHGKDHPYVYYPEMFKSNIDGLLAVKAFLALNNFKYNNKLFITGWSQGGGACLSSHKYIQESYNNEFTVLASSGLAGPYNYSGFLDNVFKRRNEEVNTMIVISWAIYSLNKFSSLKRPTDQIYSYPVFDQISSLFPPSSIPNEVLNNYFMSKVIDGSDVEFRQAMKDNSFHEGWLPTGKVFLHHGDSDKIVPYFNSVDAYNGLKAAGSDIKLYTYPNGDHTTELDNFILNTINDFSSIK